MRVEDYIASGVLEQFVLGELSAEKAAEVVRMAELYPEVRLEISRIEDTLQGMAENLAIQPPADVLEKIKANISAEKDPGFKDPLEKKDKKIHYLQYGIAASFTLKLVAMAIAAYFWVNWQHTQDQLARLQNQYDNLQQEAQQITKVLTAVSDPDFQTVVLKGSDTDSRALVYWNEKTREVYVHPYQLPENQQDQQYQLWGIVHDKPVSLGVFDLSDRSSLPQVIPMQGVEELSEFAITLEPKGGSSSPSLQSQYYEGKVK